ncbi:hypothetical protein U5801_21565 [Lamprobacter modestohalophilus]|uniref:hypothetical protein n=1 Tax=Lamprobacter modestohalophilus TaxID=1064514 RepID=UPI002ADEC7DC|nr:hypothetical protein [Lamprobacter modestohalophilus]MEA1052373.1 hypothetical protein [Lamprobacter modestohalophilus]
MKASMPSKLTLPDGFKVASVDAWSYASGVNCEDPLTVQATVLIDDVTQLVALRGKEMAFCVERPKPLEKFNLSCRIVQVQAVPQSMGQRVQRFSVTLTGATKDSSTFQIKRFDLYPSTAKETKASAILKPLLERLTVANSDCLDMPVECLVQAGETDVAFLRRVASLHGLAISTSWQGKLRLVDLAKVSNPVRIKAKAIVEQRIELTDCQQSTMEAPKWDIPRGIAADPVRVVVGEDQQRQSLLGNLWPEPHRPAAAERVAAAQLRMGRAASSCWSGRVRGADALKVLESDHIELPGLGVMAVWSRRLVQSPGEMSWHVEIEARDPLALPECATVPQARWVAGQVCDLKDPKGLGRLKVNLHGLKRTGPPAGWQGVWCPWLGAGGGARADGTKKAHGPWSPPRLLDWVAVWVDPSATSEPLILGALAHRGCNAESLGTKPEGPWVLFQEGELSLTADVVRGMWALKAGPQSLELAADTDKGITVKGTGCSLNVEKDVVLHADTMTVQAKDVAIDGEVSIHGALSVKG